MFLTPESKNKQIWKKTYSWLIIWKTINFGLQMLYLRLLCLIRRQLVRQIGLALSQFII